MWQNPGMEEIRSLLSECRLISVVGLSPSPHRDSHRVARYLARAGYDVIGVNPHCNHVLDGTCYPRLADVPRAGRAEIVNIFRRSSEAGPHVDEAIAVGARGVWMQLGVIDAAAAHRARQAGLVVVMNRCIRVDHDALLGG
jgi:predicted CoA-binding protein